MLCSIVVPTFNGWSLTERCLGALLANPPKLFDQEIIVVDDGSIDDTAERLASFNGTIRPVIRTENSGYAVASNGGADVARGDYLVFLNNDTVPEPGWLDELAAYAGAHPLAAVVGAKLLYEDGTIQHAGMVICQDLFPRHIYRGFAARHPAVNKSRRFQAVTGACMLVRRTLFNRFEGFDTRYLNGFEDVDLCLRLGAAGYEVHYCHSAVLCHFEGITRLDPLTIDRQADQERANAATYFERWGDRLRRDELDYYAQDGLLSSVHGARYPIGLAASRELATVSSSGIAATMDKIVSGLIRELDELRRDNERLRSRRRLDDDVEASPVTARSGDEAQLVLPDAEGDPDGGG